METNILFTVFTTAYNRSGLLKRLYQSLLNQTYKNFLWLIVDDGSTDDTKEVVEQLILEGLIIIEYHYKENGGKHTAMKLGFNLVRTKYMVDIDDDDELTSDCLEIFHEQWQDVEKEGRNDIGVIRALSMDEKGKICGSYKKNRDVGILDSNYIQMQWVDNRHYENISSRKMEVLHNVEIFSDDGKWLYDKVKLVLESVFWNRIAKKYNTRYVFKPLRIYHSDAEFSYTASSFTEQRCLNYTFSLYVIINELGLYKYKNMWRLMKCLAEYLSCGLASGKSISSLFRVIESPVDRLLTVFLILPSYCVGWKLRRNF